MARAAAGNQPVYGVNTGFGKLASVSIAAKDTATLQRNLILSHCCGVGEQIPARLTRLMMGLKLLSLGRGASGVRWGLIELLQAMLERRVTPIVPAQGSVGASGDLAPLAHMTAVIIGAGKRSFRGNACRARRRSSARGWSQSRWAQRRGSPLSTARSSPPRWRWPGCSRPGGGAIGAGDLRALDRRHHGLDRTAGAGNPRPARPSRADRGGGSDARFARRLGNPRKPRETTAECRTPTASVPAAGDRAAMDLLRQAGRTLEIEANAATDNPLVLTASGQIVSGGNFHAEPVAFAADIIALAVAEIGAIAQRRVALWWIRRCPSTCRRF